RASTILNQPITERAIPSVRGSPLEEFEEAPQKCVKVSRSRPLRPREALESFVELESGRVPGPLSLGLPFPREIEVRLLECCDPPPLDSGGAERGERGMEHHGSQECGVSRMSSDHTFDRIPKEIEHLTTLLFSSQELLAGKARRRDHALEP